MTKFVVMPENCRWTEVEANSAEMAYISECSWYMPGKRIAVYNTATGETVVYTRRIGSDGNLLDMQIERWAND